MCGRFTNRLTWPEIARLYRVTEPHIGPRTNFPPRYNIAPTQLAPVVVLRDGKRQVEFMRWGLVPSWAKDDKSGARLINARVETVDTKPSFRTASKARRCLVITDGFYEWPEHGSPHIITLARDEPFAFAGPWETWKRPDSTPLHTFTILTCAANEFPAQVHDRMPVILPPAAWPRWLGEETSTPENLKALCAPFPARRMTGWPVSRAIGNFRNDGPELVKKA